MSATTAAAGAAANAATFVIYDGKFTNWRDETSDSAEHHKWCKQWHVNKSPSSRVYTTASEKIANPLGGDGLDVAAGLLSMCQDINCLLGWAVHHDNNGKQVDRAVVKKELGILAPLVAKVAGAVTITAASKEGIQRWGAEDVKDVHGKKISMSGCCNTLSKLAVDLTNFKA